MVSWYPLLTEACFGNWLTFRLAMVDEAKMGFS
jgi:hypothetical protein